MPTVRNGGKPFSLRYHRVWDKKVRAFAGGLTVMAPALGQWEAPCGTLFRERMLPVCVACTAEQIEAIADITAKHYEQLAVMYFRVSDGVSVRHYDPKKKYDRVG